MYPVPTPIREVDGPTHHDLPSLSSFLGFGCLVPISSLALLQVKRVREKLVMNLMYQITNPGSSLHFRFLQSKLYVLVVVFSFISPVLKKKQPERS